MKKLVFISILIPLLAFAEEDPCQMKLPLLFLSGEWVGVSSASIKTPDYQNDKLSYSHANISGSYTHFCDPCWGWIFGGGYIGTKVAWDENPFFHDQQFSYLTFTVGAITQAIPQWTWTSTLTFLIDPDQWNLVEYALYRNITWGKFTCNEIFTFHMGYIFEVGLSKEKIWPILGGQWCCSPKWKINAVYPLQLSVDYSWKKNLTIAGSLRPFWDRYRAKLSDPLPKSVFYYRNWGAELEGTWSMLRNAIAKGFMGLSWNGDLKISNRRGKDVTQVHLKKAPYAGASLRIFF